MMKQMFITIFAWLLVALYSAKDGGTAKSGLPQCKTAYDWLCVLTVLAPRRRPRISQRALSKLHHDHHPLMD